MGLPSNLLPLLNDIFICLGKKENMVGDGCLNGKMAREVMDHGMDTFVS